MHGYTRAAPPKRRRKRRKPAKPAGRYWTCVNARTGRSCGTKHRTMTAAIKHRVQLDRTSYRAGRGRPWDVTKRGT